MDKVDETVHNGFWIYRWDYCLVMLQSLSTSDLEDSLEQNIAILKQCGHILLPK